MERRLKLQSEFENILGSRNVYYQPPASVKLLYPCIVYYKAGVRKYNANDGRYITTDQYEVTVIDRNPDSEIPNKILKRFPMCSFDRSFFSDNLNHSVFTLYY